MSLIQTHRVRSESLGDFREVTVLIPPPTGSEAVPLPIVYCVDGQLVHSLATSLVDERCFIPRVGLVGVHSDPRYRAREYLPGLDRERFRAHEEFFTGELVEWAQSELNIEPVRSRCAVFGFSNGAAFALAMGALHPDKYGIVIAFSIPSGAHCIGEDAYQPKLPAKYYLAAGTKEAPFRRKTQSVARGLTANGVENVYHDREGARHDVAFWSTEFVSATRWAFAGVDDGID